MTTEEFRQRLLNYERRVEALYLALRNRPSFPGELRAFWHRMAENVHLRRVIEAVHAFSVNKALHEQGTSL